MIFSILYRRNSDEDLTNEDEDNVNPHNYINILGAIQKLTQSLISSKTNVQSELRKLNDKHEELKEEHKQLSDKCGHLEHLLTSYKNEIVTLEETKNILNEGELEDQHFKSLNCVNCDSLCEHFFSILNELKLLITSSLQTKLEHVIMNVEENNKSFSSLQHLLDTQNQVSLIEISKTLEQIFGSQEAKNPELQVEIEKCISKAEGYRVKIAKLEHNIESIKFHLHHNCLSKMHLNQKVKFELKSALEETVAPDFDENGLNSTQVTQTETLNKFCIFLWNIIDSWDLKNVHLCEFKSDFDFDSNTNKIIDNLLAKLKSKLVLCCEQISSDAENSTVHVEVYEKEISKLSTRLKELQNIVENDLQCRLLNLESKLNYFGKDRVKTQGNASVTDYKEIRGEYTAFLSQSNTDDACDEISAEVTICTRQELGNLLAHFTNILDSGDLIVICEQITEFLSDNKNQFPRICKLFDTTLFDVLLKCCDKLNKAKNSLQNEIHKLQMNRKLSNIESDRQLKVLIVNEILNLSCNESEVDLLNYSSKVIFDNFLKCILKKEAEFVEEHEAKLYQANEDLNTVNSTVKTQASWITDLESEVANLNREIDDLKKSNYELKIKATDLSSNIINNLNEISSLNMNITKLMTDNNNLRDKLNHCDNLVVTKNDTINILTNNIQSLRKDLEEKTSKMLNLNSEIPVTLSDSHYILVKESNQVYKSETASKNQYCQTVFNEQCTCIKPADGDKLSKEVAYVDLDREKTLLIEMIMTGVTHLGATSNKFCILGDVAEAVVERLLGFENCGVNKPELQSIVDSVKELKLNILQLKECLPNDELTFKDVSGSPCNVNDMWSLKKKIEAVQNEGHELKEVTKKVQSDITVGQCFLKKLKKHYNLLLETISKKNCEIEDFQKFISKEQQAQEQKNLENDTVKKELQFCRQRIASLEEDLKSLTVQLADINAVYSNSAFHYPNNIKSVKEKIHYIDWLNKENITNASLLTEANNSITFFGYQCTLMYDYIKRLEQSMTELKERFEQCENESLTLQNELGNKQNLLLEVNALLQSLTLLFPLNVLTPHQAITMVQQILTEYKSLKIFKVKFLRKVMYAEKEITKQAEEIKSLNMLNSKLKIDQGTCEDQIRTLRSELRTLRFQLHKTASHVNNSDSTDLGIQTGK